MMLSLAYAARQLASSAIAAVGTTYVTVRSAALIDDRAYEVDLLQGRGRLQ